MAFAFSQSGSGAPPSINVGAELAEVDPETLGFSALGLGGLEGAKKLKLLPNPWPHDNLPPSCASLLSVTSKRGLVAAAGPDGLILASTEKVRKAFKEEAGDQDVISSFSPDITLAVPQLRQVAFSSGGDFLVVSAEHGGGLNVYSVDALLQQKAEPERSKDTEQTAVRALIPNPATEFEHFFAVILDSGRLKIMDVTQDDALQVEQESVVCASWSVKGKALVVGLRDGSAAQYMADGKLTATIPRPPDVPDAHIMSAVYWLSLNEFLMIHSSEEIDEEDNIYSFVQTNKERTSFSYSKAPVEVLFSNITAPPRSAPPRFSVLRLRNWEPILDDVLIVAASNSSDTILFTHPSDKISSQQEAANEWIVTNPIDSRRAQIPAMVFGEDGDSLLIGEALDLSSKEKVMRPVPLMPEIIDSGAPLPAYFTLNHQGILSAWWLVWNKALDGEKVHPYPGLMYPNGEAEQSTASSTAFSTASAENKTNSVFGQAPTTTSTPNAPASTQTSSVFGQPTPGFGTPLAPNSGTPSTSSFGQVSAPAFGKPAVPAFGQTSSPAFGAPSAIGGASGTAFGATGGLGNRASPWASTSQTPVAQPKHNPFSSAAQPKANPFATPAQPKDNPFSSAGSQSSGFAKFGNTNGVSSFSSFGSVSDGPSSFASLGGQKPAFGGTSGGFKGLSKEPSFGGETVSLSSRDGSTLTSWGNTPAQQGGSIFGQNSSFTSTKSSETTDAEEAQRRQRDEATPTPQALKPQTPGIFGLPSNGFKLGSTFKGDGSAKDDLPKPPAPSSSSLFGNDFSSTLGGTATKPPETPTREEGQEKRLQEISTTPASPPKPTSSLFPSSTPKAPVPVSERVLEDAPLPPDPTTWKPAKKDDDDIPPLAGSPPVEVHIPKSSGLSSSEEEEESEGDGEEDFDVEEQEGEEANEPSPSDAARRSRTAKPAWNLQDSVNQPPRFPAAPTPPVVKSGTSSRSGRSQSPAHPLFGQASKPAPLSFGQSSSGTTGFPKPPTQFAPAKPRTQETLRSPSPARSASTSAIGTRRHPVIPPGASSLSASIQAKPPSLEPALSDLEDDEDERIRQLLASDIEPSRVLDKFLAHQDYTGASLTKTGHAAQIELVYRDINSMVDTLGLNCRSLKAFIEYHERPQHYTERTRASLEEVEQQGENGSWFENWCLQEIFDLQSIEKELEGELDAGRIQNVLEKLGELTRLLRDKARIMTKVNDIRRQIINRKDPGKLDAIRKASLPKELADQQKALRNNYAALLSQMSKAEEAVILCRSKLASASAQNGKMGAVPTVDAIKKTINKMITLTEKKNSEIALLESQFRRIGLGEPLRPTSSSSRQPSTPARHSRALRDESPFVTPPTNRSKLNLSELNRRAMTPEADTTPSKGYGLFYTPPGSPGDPENELLQIENAVEDNLDDLRTKSRRRRGIAKSLSNALLERGVKTTRVG